MIESLQIIVYVLLILLIIVGITLGVKLIMTLSKIDDLVDDVTEKVKSFDKVFEIVNIASDKMSMISDAVIGFITTGIKKVFGKTKRSKKIEEDDIDE